MKRILAVRIAAVLLLAVPILAEYQIYGRRFSSFELSVYIVFLYVGHMSVQLLRFYPVFVTRYPYRTLRRNGAYILYAAVPEQRFSSRRAFAVSADYNGFCFKSRKTAHIFGVYDHYIRRAQLSRQARTVPRRQAR